MLLQDRKNLHVAKEKHSYSSKELLAMLQDSFRKSDELLEKLKQELRDE
jgi:type I restriction enzyme M protein